jgi:RNase P/RNase MRP subunit POP5
LGTLEAGKAGILFLKDKYQNNTGVVKTGHKYVDKVRTALALIKAIDSKEVVFRTRIVSGILKKAINKFNEIKRLER